MKPQPVVFDVVRPPRFERAHVVVRLLLLFVLSLLGGSIGWTFFLLYLLLPAAAAVMLSQRGGDGFREEGSPSLARLVHWVLAIYSYLALLTDRLPTGKPAEVVRFEVKPDGRPTPGSALARLVYSLPALLFLAVLGLVSGLVWLVAMVMVLIDRRYPESFYDFQRGVLRFEARLLAYHASLVEEYPPFSLAAEPGEQAEVTPTAIRPEDRPA